MKIILGSASPRRHELFRELGYEFDIIPPGIDEKAIRVDDLRTLPLAIARSKSKALVRQMTRPVIVVTCDTVVIHDGKLREKPSSESQAREYLRTYSDHPAEVICGVVAANTKTGKSLDGVESAKVFFHRIPDSVIDDLIEHGAILDAAGGFMAQMQAINKYITHIDGSMDTVMGLPRALTKRLIEQILL